MKLSPDKKIAGILAPLFALRGEEDLGIGDIAALREFIDWAAENGFRLVQLLPINEIGEDNSPYNAISSRAIEPTTLQLAPGSPEELTREDFERIVAKAKPERWRGGGVKYPLVKKLKRSLLESAFARFKTHGSDARKSAFQEFCAKESVWLEEYTLFRVLMRENKRSTAWDRWPTDHCTAEKAHTWLSSLSPKRQSDLANWREFFAYVQWIAAEQWRDCKAYTEKRGVALMGDIPFGVSYYSADVFTRPGEFKLDWSGGAPPEIYFKDDAFTQKWGQNWGIPIYDWAAMRANNLQWWRQRIDGVKQIFHVFRIDHVLGFYRIYTFPWRPQKNAEFLPLSWEEMLKKTGGRIPHFAPRDDSNPQNCEANQREGESYLRIVLEESGATRVTGEDLGIVPDYVRPNLHSLGIAGFKIPQWEVRHHHIVPGAQYEPLSVATYATHDHKPVRALWREAFEETTPTSNQAREELEKIAQFAGLRPKGEAFDFERDFYPAIMKALFQSGAWIAVVMITDLLGQRDRFNVPGTEAKTNWARRMHMTAAQLRANRGVSRRMGLIEKLLVDTGRV